MRIFSLRNNRASIPQANVAIFKWAALDIEVARQIGFQEQYLNFHKYLLENLQSVPEESQHYAPRPISLSLRAGAVKAYVVLACSIIEGVLANWGAKQAVSPKPETLLKKPLGGLLRAWCIEDGLPRDEIAPIWNDLTLLHEYRNFVHLGRAVGNDNAYWQNVLERENDLVEAADRCVAYLAECCKGF